MLQGIFLKFSFLQGQCAYFRSFELKHSFMNFNHKIFQPAKDFLGLFYPNLCLACREKHLVGEEIICVQCQYQLPKTNFHLHKENEFTHRFWGRLDLFAAASLFRFTKKGKVQRLIHELKYKGKRNIGVKLGAFYGHDLKESELFKDVDCIIPVPLHPKKLHKRGFNQSDLFAQGLAESMGIPWYADGLKRRIYTETQTLKSRSERLANVAEAFEVHLPKRMEGKHILLVDDVITTGATLEACGLKLLEIPHTRLSMSTIVFAGQ